jgi:dihydroxyacetone kinase-like protein
VVTADLVACFRRVLERTEAVQGQLDRLDAVAGDGDHGVTMVLGWRAVCAALERSRPDFPRDALRVAAEAFADVGGSAGPLWGTALLRAARAVDDAPELDLDAVARAAAAAVQRTAAAARRATERSSTRWRRPRRRWRRLRATA